MNPVPALPSAFWCYPMKLRKIRPFRIQAWAIGRAPVRHRAPQGSPLQPLPAAVACGIDLMTDEYQRARRTQWAGMMEGGRSLPGHGVEAIWPVGDGRYGTCAANTESAAERISLWPSGRSQKCS